MNGPHFYAIVKLAGRILLGGLLIFAGVSHLTWSRVDFLAQVPPWLPMSPALVVLLSGIVEIGLGMAVLILQKQRVKVGWTVAAFLVAIFPGNISQWLNHRDAFNMHSDRDRFLRLFIQPVFIAYVLWCSDAWASYRRRKTQG